MKEEEIEKEYQKCKKSLSYFAKNYARIGTPDGSRKLNDVELERLKLIEIVQKEGGHLRRVWMRNKYRWVIIKD